jgi:hypothetical protein
MAKKQPSKAITKAEPDRNSGEVSLKAPEVQSSEEIAAVHQQYQKIIAEMQRSYEAEFEGLKSFILKSNRRHKQNLKNSEKTHHQ